MKKQPPSSANLSPALLAEQGQEHLRLGRFKDAIEAFKQLARRDPQPKWKPLLDQAYVGRARALAAKGMVKEAQIVLENTADAKGVVSDPLFYLGCLIRQAQFRKAADYCRKAVDSGAAEAASFSELAAVLGLAAPASGLPAPASVASAEKSLAAWCAGAPADEVDRLLQAISLRSSARPLRLILKSLLQTGDEGKRAGLLEMIPETSAFVGLARVAAVAPKSAGDVLAAWSGLSSAQQAFIAETRSVPTGSVKLLKDIDEAERRGPEALLALLLSQADRLPKTELRAACLEMLPRLPDRLRQIETICGPLTEFEKSRALALDAESRQDWGATRRHWEKAAGALQAEGLNDSRLGAAIIYRHLAELTRKVQDSRERCPGGDASAHYLELSMDLDPEDADSLLALLRRHIEADRIKEWTKWVEWAIPRFPGNSAVLEAAVDAATRRNAYKKAASYAHKLLAIDPINQRARQRMIELRVAHARKQMRSKRADLALKELTQAGEWERPGSPDPQLGISRAMVVRELAPGPESEVGLRASLQAAGGGVAGWFRALLEAKFMDCPEPATLPLLRELDSATKSHPPTKEDALAAVALLRQREVRDHKRTAEQALHWIEPWLAAGALCDWSLEEFQTIAETLHDVGGFNALAAHAKQGLQRNVPQPAYQFYAIVARIGGDARRLSFEDEAVLDDMRGQAWERQDFHLVNRIERLMNVGRSDMEDYFEADDDDADDDSSGPVGELLDLLGIDKINIMMAAQLLGVDGVINQVIASIKKEEKKRGLFPIPIPLIKVMLRTLIQDELETATAPRGRKPASKRRRTSQPEFEF